MNTTARYIRISLPVSGREQSGCGVVCMNHCWSMIVSRVKCMEYKRIVICRSLTVCSTNFTWIPCHLCYHFIIFCQTTYQFLSGIAFFSQDDPTARNPKNVVNSKFKHFKHALIDKFFCTLTHSMLHFILR